MATYVTKKCPHCGYAYQVLQSGEQRKYGCPYKTCTHCNNSYWDTDIKEPALHGYSNAYEVTQSIKRGITILLYAPMGLLILGAGVYLLINGEIIGLLALLIGGSISWVIFSYFKRKHDDSKQKDEIVAEQQRDYDASVERLKNTQYLTALAEHDSRAKKLLHERTNGQVEHYAQRPEL